MDGRAFTIQCRGSGGFSSHVDGKSVTKETLRQIDAKLSEAKNWVSLTPISILHFPGAVGFHGSYCEKVSEAEDRLCSTIIVVTLALLPMGN